MKQFITFLLLAMLANMASAQTVNIEGNPYGNNPYGTIQAAIADSTNPDDVILITGVHTEAISVFNKSITLRGTDPTLDIIEAPNSSVTSVISLSASSNDPDPLPVLNINIENLGVRNGNAMDNGGGINIDKVIGKATLRNLIIENNTAVKNGGALGLAGSNVDIVECTIRNNSSSLDGGAIIAAPNNGSGTNNIINIKQSLIDNNVGRNGGGIFINGNPTFGNDYLIEVNIENSTISNNEAFSPTDGNGGGSIFSASRPWTANTAIGNISLMLVHATFYNNIHANANKSGIQFGTAKETNFSAYNSIIVGTSDDLLTKKAINFANSNTTNVINCILGGLLNAPLAIIDDTAKNNLKGRTATESGLDIASGLQSLGGKTQVFAILDKSVFAATTADDYCTAVTGISLPSIDQRGYTREGVQDAGAFEFEGTLSTNNISNNETFRIYPNPTHNMVYIKSANPLQEVVIYDMTGKSVLRSQKFYDNSLDVSNLNTGLYTVKIQDSQSNSASNKLVISR